MALLSYKFYGPPSWGNVELSNTQTYMLSTELNEYTHLQNLREIRVFQTRCHQEEAERVYQSV